MNEILGVDDFDVFACYSDLWKTESKKQNSMRQGIIYSGGCTENCMKLRINASDKDDSNLKNKAIADAYGNRNRLCYEIMFNDYNRVIKSLTELTSPKVPEAMYKILHISLEYEIVTQPDLTSRITMEYQRMIWPYDRILRNRQIPVNKSDTM